MKKVIILNYYTNCNGLTKEEAKSFIEDLKKEIDTKKEVQDYLGDNVKVISHWIPIEGESHFTISEIIS